MVSRAFSSAAQLSSAFSKGLPAQLSSAQQTFFPAQLAQLREKSLPAQLSSAIFFKICNSGFNELSGKFTRKNMKIKSIETHVGILQTNEVFVMLRFMLINFD